MRGAAGKTAVCVVCGCVSPVPLGDSAVSVKTVTIGIARHFSEIIIEIIEKGHKGGWRYPTARRVGGGIFPSCPR